MHIPNNMKKILRVATVPISLNILLKGQLEYLQKHFDITAVSGAGADLDEVAAREGVKTHAIEMQRQISPVKDFISLVKLYVYFKRKKPDIIHSLTPKAGLLSMIAGRLAGVPIRMHTFTGLIFPYRQGAMQKLLIAMDKLLCSCATNIYPEGLGVKKDLQKFKITDKPLKILGNGNINGIETSYFDRNTIAETEARALKIGLNISDEDFVFVFVGRLVGDKGINELVSAFSKMSASNHDRHCKLLLVGPFEQDLDPLSQETLQEIERNPKIITVGFQKDVRIYLAISDVLAFPSYREGFPNVVLQAGAMELNAIVTDISGSNEIIIDGQNGWVIPVRDADALAAKMIWCLENKQDSAMMGARSRVRVVEKYDRKIVWQALEKEYEALLT